MPPNKPVPARFTFLLDPELKRQFEELCEQQDITPSQLLRQMIKAHLSEHQDEPAAPSRTARRQ